MNEIAEKIAYVNGKAMGVDRLKEFIEALPTSQKSSLKAMYEKGGYYAEHAPTFLWETHSGTVRIVRSMAKKGLLVAEEREIQKYRGTVRETTVVDTMYTIHPLVAEILRAEEGTRRAWSAERQAKQDAEILARDTERLATNFLIAEHREEYVALLASIETKLREERGL